MNVENCVVCGKPVFWAKTSGSLSQFVGRLPLWTEPATNGGGYLVKFEPDAMITNYVSAAKRASHHVLYKRHSHSKKDIARARSEAREKDREYRQ